ncbi:hypothetical protein Asp14428_74880 [Actinoplanes sp. NBRC 14428]|nr:hypothetical protein Asp14428_74880 [Actinoplanes sp. NBRC 14428]
MRAPKKRPEYATPPATTHTTDTTTRHPDQAHPTTPAAVLALQRLIGNAGVGTVLGATEHPMHPEPPEQATQVEQIAHPEQVAQLEEAEHSGHDERVAHSGHDAEHEAGSDAGYDAGSSQAESQAASVRDVLSSPGRPLDAAVRSEMEPMLGTDLSHVRIHTDQAAHNSAESLSAQAYTSQSHIVFQRDRYDPGSASGRHTLAHELMHVVQQQQGPVAGTDTGAGLAVSDRSDRYEREAEEAAAGIVAGIPHGNDHEA